MRCVRPTSGGRRASGCSPSPRHAPTRARPDWRRYRAPAPRFTGVRTVADVGVADLIPYIDWTPFFRSWELAGTYPAILDDETVGRAARSLFDDARAMLDRIVAEGSFEPRAAIGFWPAWSVDDDIELFGNSERGRPVATLHTLRQQMSRTRERPNHALADFVAPQGSGVDDHVGGFALTVGEGVERVAADARAGATTTTAPSWSRPSATGWRRPSRNSLHELHAQGALGLRVERSLGERRADRGALSRDQARARLSRLSRPQRETDYFRATGGRGPHRAQTHRELRHVAGVLRLRPLFSAIRKAHISGSASSAAIRWRTMPSAREPPSRRPRRGSRRILPTTRTPTSDPGGIDDPDSRRFQPPRPLRHRQRPQLATSRSPSVPARLVGPQTIDGLRSGRTGIRACAPTPVLSSPWGAIWTPPDGKARHCDPRQPSCSSIFGLLLEAQGWRVIRFWNSDVMGNLPGMLESIAAEIERPPSSPRPSTPHAGGEGEQAAPPASPFRPGV